VINIVGPRQTGQDNAGSGYGRSGRFSTSTMKLFASLPSIRMASLVRCRARQGSRTAIVITRFQRLPRITLALKRIVDRDRRAGQFVLTGSSTSSPCRRHLIIGRPRLDADAPSLERRRDPRAGPCHLLDIVADDHRFLQASPALRPSSAGCHRFAGAWRVPRDPAARRSEPDWLGTIPMSTA